MKNKKTSIWLGFEGKPPYAIILIHQIYKRSFKKICYDEAEVNLVVRQFPKEEGYVLEKLYND